MRRVVNVAAAVALLIAGVAGALWSRSHQILINKTGSLRNWGYIVDVGRLPERGEMVAFMPPPNPYYSETFVKVVGGVPGDVVERDGRTYRVAGRPIGEAKENSARGLPLAPGPTGVLPPGHYFVYAPHKDSYDSRYADIGWVPAAAVLGAARPIL